MTLADLSPADRVAAIDAFSADYLRVLHHLLSDPAYGTTHTMAALLDSVEQRTVPDVPVLATVVSWTFFEMQFRRKARALTDDERAIEDAGWRLSDALHGGHPFRLWKRGRL